MERLYDELGELIGEYETYSEAMEAACRRFDAEDGEQFKIVEDGGGMSFTVRGYTLMQSVCPICGKTYRQYQMEMTRDCHGIPFRRVCGRCYDNLMEYPGYDGRYYDETDDCIDYDY